MDVIYQTWTKEMCAAEAAKFNNRSDFFRKSPKAYKAAITNGWLDDVTAHMVFLRKPQGYWTKKKCAEVARRYSVRKEFQNKEKGCYIFALRRGWLDEICSHMERQGSRFERYIYIIISREARQAYVGLTFNKMTRLNQHRLRGRSAVRSLLASPHKIVWSRLLGRDDAAILEDDLIQRLRERGYEVVNATRGGNLGGSTLVWTFEACLAEAQKYQSRSAFQRAAKGAYASAQKNGWFEAVCAHMILQKMPNGTWNRERCAQEAQNYRSRAEFKRGSLSAYNTCLRNGWMDEFCSHMNPRRVPWTKEMCAEVARKHNSRATFASRDGAAYQAAWKNGWLDEICSHMVIGRSNPVDR
ncbi:MAG: GIY-YIG nuclease family protein [Hyphomicrobium sp.]